MPLRYQGARRRRTDAAPSCVRSLLWPGLCSGRFQLWTIGLLPFVLVFLLNALWPGYFKPLEGSVIGYIMIGGAATLWVVAVVLARKVLTVDL